MPRTIIAAVANSPGGYPTAAVVHAETAADVGNGNRCLHTGENFFIVVRNAGTTTRVVTVSSVADSAQHRTGDLTHNLTTGQRVKLGPFRKDGWMQSDGYLYFSGAHAEVKFAVEQF